MSPKQQRLMRAYQAKSRGSAISFKTELENAQIILAWECGDLSEGQVSEIFNTDRVSVRKMRDDVRAAGIKIAEALVCRAPAPKEQP